MKWAIFLLNIIISVMSFVCVKISSSIQQDTNSILYTPIFNYCNLFYWLGFMFYTSSFFCYAILIDQLPIQIAQTVVTCLIIIIISLIASIFWKEPFSMSTVIGISLITAGMAIINCH
ncbi:hypothetical protein lam_890 [Candidatus Liberibacter americanus str. Sao Paulo]|uniref:EamA domain-containing protein n=1 Tax=Candidatus Liberibacter americanus str. Sao Paulo TaxID=1261131 RepID=U6B5T2_9HYPH|nr:hypothetical protein lam_890 [Candidatus Liberibacter americanus str. Sao Paulo]EMS36263.1 putative transmembrane protein [Candidatus Liberibacter americanus PW_SP]